MGIHQGRKAVDDLFVFNPDGRNFDNLVVARHQTGRFKVKKSKFTTEILILITVNHIELIFNQITLDPIKDLDFFLVAQFHHFRIGLQYSVVSDPDDIMTKVGRLFHDLIDLTDCIHSAELTVQMKLHPFNRGIVGFFCLFGQIDVAGIKHHFPGIFIIIDLAFNQIPATFFNAFNDLFFVGEDFTGNTVGIIGDIKGQQGLVIFKRPGTDPKHPTPDDQTFPFGLAINIKIHIFQPIPGIGNFFSGDHVPGLFSLGKLGRAGRTAGVGRGRNRLNRS